MKFKITKSIIDNSMSLIGFFVKGKDKDLGGVSDEQVERSISLQNMAAMNFRTLQLSVSNAGIVEGKNFKINSLPMVMYNNNGYVPVDNRIEIIKRFEQIVPGTGKREKIGFRLRFADGSENNFKYKNTIVLSRWFKPTNFCVKTKSNGTLFISGNGIALDDIPCEIIGDTPERINKRAEPSTEKANKHIKGLTNDFDIIDVCDLISSVDGSIIKFIGDNYVPISKDIVTSEEFTPYNVGEVASAKLKFNASKLNVNANFKKPGQVLVNGMNIPTFVYRTKSIFVAGEGYVKTFGVAIPKANENNFVQTIGKSMAIEKVTDNMLLQPLNVAVAYNNYTFNDYSFYRIKLGNIDLISNSRREKSILSTNQIAELCKRLYEYKVVNKAMGTRGGLLGELREKLGPEGIAKATSKRPAGIFQFMGQDQLNEMTNRGFDVYTGAYIKAPVVQKGASSGDAETKVEIVYNLKGLDAGKITAKSALEYARNNDTTKLTSSMIELIMKVANIPDLNQQYSEANKLYYQTEAEIEKINRMFWMHNASMFLAGNKNKVHTHDKGDWTLGNTRAKNAEVYTNNSIPNLSVKITGVTI